MRHFKSTLPMALLASLVLIGCTPNRNLDGGGEAPFIVKDGAYGTAKIASVSDTALWHVPTAIEVTFSVCLQDRSSRSELRNQNIFVSIPGTSKGYDALTTSNGCMLWTESIAYNYFAGRSAWVKVRRDLVSRGTYSGHRTVEFAVDPWAVGDHSRDPGSLAVVNLHDDPNGRLATPLYDGAEATAILAGQHPTQGNARFSIQTVKVEAERESEGLKDIGLRYTLTTEPRIYTHRANGDDFYEQVRDGEFNIDMQLMSVNAGPSMNQRVLILDSDSGIKSQDSGRVQDGMLRAEFKISQALRANQGNMELAVRITPRAIGGASTLLPFTSIYKLGAGSMADSGGGLEPLACVKAGVCDFDKVVSSAINYGKSKDEFLKENPYFQANEGYVFSNLRLGFFMVQAGETATQRTIAYTASTCVTDKQTGRPLADTPMVIHYVHQRKWADLSAAEKATYADQTAEQKELEARTYSETHPEDKAAEAAAAAAKKYLDQEHLKKKWVDQHDEIERDDIAKSTDASGCLNWDGSVFHKYYQPEQYFVRNIEIRKASGFKQAFTFYLNPWDTNIYFGRDKRELTDEKIAEIEHRKPIPSRFFLGNYSYHTVRFLYNIDPFMDLEVKKTVLMELSPQVLRYSGIKDARKMTEHLRDGIYMMKVGIQKSYLDPRDNSGFLLHNKTPNLQAKLESIGSEKLATKQFITTNMALVRVVDGYIIYPIELTMRDLRLMRVRSNFMVELETVDERLIQAYHKIRESQIDKEQIRQHLLEFRKSLTDTAKLSDVFKQLEAQASPLSKNVGGDIEVARQKAAADQKTLQEKIAETQKIIADKLQLLSLHFQNGGAIGQHLDSLGRSTGVPYEIAKNESIQDNFGLDQSQLEELKVSLQQNDFSEMRLPTADEIDLNLFVETNSGLQPRSFVGPVIFLSNAYSDSVRATDNLDEANCSSAAHPKDWLKQSAEFMRLNMIERDLGLNASAALDGTRQNNAYQYNPYFGSLSNLCYKNVDDLILEEQDLKKQNEDRMTAASLKYNFVNSFGFDMDFVSLTNEPLQKVAPDCKSNVKQCLQTTVENTIKAESLISLINDNLPQGREQANNAADFLKYWHGQPYLSQKTSWTEAEYPQLFFEYSLDGNVALCNLLANRISKEAGDRNLTAASRAIVYEKIMDVCPRDGGLVHDLKYHIERTGNYTFLGGLNLNFNVAENFSMGWSKSWSAGLELNDFIGPIGGMGSLGKAIGGIFIKPMSLKVGTSMSESTGTSVSESTYLVSQIAKFELDLLGYEKCSVIRLSDSSYAALRTPFGNSNFNSPEFERAAKRGLMICEGDTRLKNPPKRVEEMYFYFTQHFTEGDMLDQADLYNHPWLLSMRGMRDFSVFENKIRKQENATFLNFVWGGLGMDQENDRDKDPLEHMRRLYANVLPSFPGYYTVLGPDEDISAFLLQQSREQARGGFEKNASDPDNEVNHRQVETPGVLPSTPKSAGDGSADQAQ